MDFPGRLKHLRHERGLTQKQVYSAVGMSAWGYPRYEYGERSPSFDCLIALADFYGVSLDYLVGRSDDPTCTPSAGTIPCSASKDGITFRAVSVHIANSRTVPFSVLTGL